MKETDFNEAQESKEENIDVKELLFKYLIHWPWFVGAVVACLIAAWVYLYISTPVYNISATVLIKDDKKGGSAGMLSGLESLGLDGMVSSSQNIDNEIEVLRSKTIVKEVVEDLGLYISYTDEDEFPSRNMYKTSPVQVSLTPQEADLLEEPMIVEMTLQPQGSMDVTVKIDGLAASAASVIAMAGTKVLMSPVAMMMIHNPATIAIGDTAEMKKAIEMLDEVKESIMNAYEIKTGLNRTKISHLMDAESWFNAKKAVELGFADEVLFDKGKEENSEEKEEEKEEELEALSLIHI